MDHVVGSVMTQSETAPTPSEPRTVAGRAWLSGMRPHHRRAATPLVVSIDREAAKPAIEALRAADAVLGDLAALDPAKPSSEALRELIERARAAQEAAEQLLASD
jgi:hypothetical protein